MWCYMLFAEKVFIPLLSAIVDTGAHGSYMYSKDVKHITSLSAHMDLFQRRPTRNKNSLEQMCKCFYEAESLNHIAAVILLL